MSLRMCMCKRQRNLLNCSNANVLIEITLFSALLKQLRSKVGGANRNAKQTAQHLVNELSILRRNNLTKK